MKINVKRQKIWAIVLLAPLLMSFLNPVPAFAYTDEEIADLLETIQDQESQISLLTEQITYLNNQLINQSGQTYEPQPTSKPPGAPKVKLLSPTTVTVKNGITADVELTVKNIGSFYATNILTQASVSSGEAPFSLQFLNSSNSISSLYEGYTQSMTLRIKTDQDAKAGTYPVTLTHSYRNEVYENFSETDSLLIKVESTVSATAVPKMTMSGFALDKAGIQPGDEFSLSAVLRNPSAASALDVQVNAAGFDADKIFPTDSGNSAFFLEMNSLAQETLAYALKASPKVQPGSYPIAFKIKYRDAGNKDYEEEFSFYVNILSGAETVTEKAQIEVTELAAPDGVYDSGETFAISMTVANISAQTAKNIKITAASDADGAVVPKSSSIQLIASLPANESKHLRFLFAPTAKSQSQSYALNFKIEYETGSLTDGEKPEIFSFEQYAGVSVVNSKADKAAEEEKEEEETDKEKNVSTPRIIVKSYQSDPVLVKAGQQFDLNLEFQNTHSLKAVGNIKANIAAVDTTEKKGSVFTPVEGSNTLFFDSIPPKGTVERNMRMYAVPDAAPRTYTLQIKFSYEDSEFNKYEDVDEIGINVKQVVDLMTSDISMPETVMLGQPVYVSFSLSNTGKTTLQNLQARIEGDFDTTGSMVYFGTLAQSGSTMYDGQFTPAELGKRSGKVIITFEDDTGEKFERTQEFSFEATEMPLDELFIDGLETGPDPASGGIAGLLQNPWIWAAAAFVIAAVIAAVVLIRRRKMKQQEGFDEDA
ncbi:MAG: hypothetical protein LBT44_06875 [Clostridiales bacterium]|jgi:uncharacterized membrane protein/uncharacterized coiled-coil protein SlyX|nr:hypothetical protein [Clostridiales bacterium]